MKDLISKRLILHWSRTKDCLKHFSKTSLNIVDDQKERFEGFEKRLEEERENLKEKEKEELKLGHDQ